MLLSTGTQPLSPPPLVSCTTALSWVPSLKTVVASWPKAQLMEVQSGRWPPPPPLDPVIHPTAAAAAELSASLGEGGG